LPITVVVASRLMVRARSVEQLFPGIQLSSSAGTAEHLSITDSWETPDLGEVPITITQTYKFAIEMLSPKLVRARFNNVIFE
jgi:hypothetical protein